jgi:hypothetical protein
MALGGQIFQQPAEKNEVIDTGGIAQGRLSFTQPAEPAEQMRMAAQLAEPRNVREIGAEIAEKAARHTSIEVYGARAQGKGEYPDLRFEDLRQAGLALAPRHDR